MKKDKNLILMVPKKNSSIQWEKNDSLITLKMMRNSIFDKAMNKIFKTPKTISIQLDELGSFVWEQCDGNKNLNQISEDLHNKFGKDANPVLERLVTYIRILRNNNLIDLK